MNENAADLLNKYSDMLCEIQEWYDEEEEIRQKIQHAKVQTLSSQPVGKGRHSDLSNNMVLLAKVKDRRDKKIHEFFDLILENVERFYNMDNADDGFLLYQIYVLHNNVKQIANRRYVSDRTIRYRHANALKQFDNLIHN